MRSIAEAVSSRKPLAPAEPQTLAGALRTAARAVDAVGVLLLHLAEEAERPAEADPLLSPAEAAKDLRCSESHIRNECARGRIRAIKSRAWYIRRSALRSYERSLTQGGAA